METKSGFDLEEALSKWGEEMRVQRGMSAEQARELEAHLRDSFARLDHPELTPEERFLIAQRRLGAPEQLEEEFHKLPPRGSSRPSRVTRAVVWGTTIGSFAALALGEVVMRAMGAYPFLQNEFGRSAGLFTTLLITNLPLAIAPLLLGVAGCVAVWAYLRARRPSLRWAIIGLALVLPALLSALYSGAWQAARVLGLFVFGDMFSPELFFHRFSGAAGFGPFPVRSVEPPVVASLFRTWWFTMWALLACRELYLHAREGSGLAPLRTVRERICRVLDAE